MTGLPPARLIGVETVRRDDRHRAFTSLVGWRDAWWCAFRTATGHVSHDGEITICRRDRAGEGVAGEWAVAATIASPDPDRPDLRDPTLVVVGERLWLVATAARRRPDDSCQTWCWTDPLTDRPPAVAVGPVGWWLWSVVATDGALTYGAYSTPGFGADRPVAAVWRSVVPATADAVPEPARHLVDLDRGARAPTEVALATDGTEWACLLRRDRGSARLGRAPDPAGPWRWTGFGGFVGGPELRYHGAPGELLAAGRTLRPRPSVAVWRVDADDRIGRPTRLPSGGDCGYPGLLAIGPAEVALSYYSGDGSTTGVEVARLRLD